jgi:hypothetical protein
MSSSFKKHTPYASGVEIAGISIHPVCFYVWQVVAVSVLEEGPWMQARLVMPANGSWKISDW